MKARAGWTYEPRDDDHDVDVDELVRVLPPNAKVKGVIIETTFDHALRAGYDRAKLEAKCGIPQRRFMPFLDYPYAEYVDHNVRIARLLYPRLPTARAMRLTGRRHYPMFAETVAGRVIFGVFGNDAERVAPLGPKGWQIGLNFGQVEAEILGPKHLRYHFTDMPALLSTVSIGVVEGALETCGVVGEVRYAERDAGNASYDISWR